MNFSQRCTCSAEDLLPPTSEDLYFPTTIPNPQKTSSRACVQSQQSAINYFANFVSPAPFFLAKQGRTVRRSDTIEKIDNRQV